MGQWVSSVQISSKNILDRAIHNLYVVLQETDGDGPPGERVGGEHEIHVCLGLGGGKQHTRLCSEPLPGRKDLNLDGVFDRELEQLRPDLTTGGPVIGQ